MRRRLLWPLVLLLVGCNNPAVEVHAGAAPSASARTERRARLRVADQAGLTKSSLSMAGELNAPYDIEWSSFTAVADRYLAEGLIPKPLPVAEVFDARFDALVNPR
jgi:hypothetical protein